MNSLNKTIKYSVIVLIIALVAIYLLYTVWQFCVTVSTGTILLLAGIYICRHLIVGIIRVVFFLMKVGVLIVLLISLFM